MRTIKIFIAVTLLFTATVKVRAEQNKVSGAVAYTTEGQTDWKNKFNWVNLWQLEGEYRIIPHGRFILQTISTYKTREKRILDDLQTFSNIEEDNMYVNLFIAGYEHRIGELSVFGGIRNVNEDYFAGEAASFFTNSSCGIFPTLSCNYPIANYPDAAMAIHMEIGIPGNILIKNSTYNGVAGKIDVKGSPVLRVRPRKDGIMNLTEMTWLSPSMIQTFYSVGFGFSTKNHFSKTHPGFNYTLWANIEQGVYDDGTKDITLLAQGSISPSGRNDCSDYFGAGLVFNGFTTASGNDRFGAFVNRANFGKKRETTAEISWQYHWLNRIYLQPAIHIIKTGRDYTSAGILRLHLEIGTVN